MKEHEQKHQEQIIFTSEGLTSGVCEFVGDASRFKKKHVRDANGQITSTWHAPVLGFLQRNSTKFVAVNMPAVEIKAGKPGTLPEKKQDVHALAKEVIGQESF